MRIEKGLKKVAGVEDAGVNLATERATVTLDPTIATTDNLIAKVRATGYDAAPFVERAEVTPVQERTDSTATDNEPHGEIALRMTHTRVICGDAETPSSSASR